MWIPTLKTETPRSSETYHFRNYNNLSIDSDVIFAIFNKERQFIFVSLFTFCLFNDLPSNSVTQRGMTG
jgi:hypothetical protein